MLIFLPIAFAAFCITLVDKKKANPSPNGNGFAFNLLGEPYVNYPNTLFTVKSGFCFVLPI